MMGQYLTSAWNVIVECGFDYEQCAECAWNISESK